MFQFRKNYAPGYCKYKSGYNEIRWDVVGCNLACSFCWSPASRPEFSSKSIVQMSTEGVINDTLDTLVDPSATFIRFTGGEPTLYWEDLMRVFKYFEQDSHTCQIPILVQTNGVRIGHGEVDLGLLAVKTRQLYLVELSFKGTNHEEFTLLTGKPEEWYESQIRAYQTLLDITQQNPNFQVVAVLGVYHSSVKGKSKYVFVEPHTERILFDDINMWDPEFRTLWQSTELKWVERLRMSPKGVWEKLYKKCGPEGESILRYYTDGVDTNPREIFPAKPQSSEYAAQIVTNRYWNR